jgi:hypothetical protein
MEKLNIAEVKEALSKTTQGPWVPHTQVNGRKAVITENFNNLKIIYRDANIPDAHLAAKAPEWLASLVAEVERLRAIEEHAIQRIKAETKSNASLVEQVEEMQKTLEIAKAYLESSSSWNQKKYNVFHQIEQTIQSLKGETT